MRPHGHARIDSRHPEALGICYRCGFTYNRDDLKWQFDWQFGPRLHNIGTIVCEDCYDKPQPSGRPIVLPPDPETVDYASPEYLTQADNPVTGVGYNVANAFLPTPLQSLGANIGNMTLNAGVNAAFDGQTNKRSPFCAGLSISNAGFQNTVGKNWNADPSGVTLTLPSTATAASYILASFTIYGPNDTKILNSATGVTNFNIEGSLDASTWTTIYTGATAGTVGETISGTITSTGSYTYHQLNIQGDGVSAVNVAQVQFNAANSFPNDI